MSEKWMVLAEEYVCVRLCAWDFLLDKSYPRVMQRPQTSTPNKTKDEEKNNNPNQSNYNDENDVNATLISNAFW